MTDQAKVLRQMAQAAEQVPGRGASTPRVITVASGKGGVGKTNLTVNLGVALASTKRRVAIIDADIGLANVDIALGLRPTYTLRHVLLEGRSLDEALMLGPGGVHVVAGGSGVHELEGLDPQRLKRFVSVLGEMDAVFDVVLIDTGAGVGPHVLSFASSSPETLMVVTPDPSAIADAYAVMKAVALHHKHVRWLLAVNMVHSPREGQQTFERLSAAAQRFLGISPVYLGAVPRDEAVERAVRMQSPFVLAYPRAPAARSVEDMARQLVEEPAEPSRGLTGFVRRLLQLGRS